MRKKFSRRSARLTASYPENSKVLAFREHDGETILVIANLSRFSGGGAGPGALCRLLADGGF
jgi:hypothetical protein